MEAVEYLMVGEDGYVEVVVDEAAMERVVNRRELDASLLIVEDALQSVRLLTAVCQYIDVYAIVLQFPEGIDEEVEVLVEDGLRMGVEGYTRSIDRCRLTISLQLDAAEADDLLPELLWIDQYGSPV